MAFNYHDPIINKMRSGLGEDGYVPLNEPQKIINGKVILTEIPNYDDKVTVTGESVTWVETFDSDGLTANQFYVDYQNGQVFFHSSREGLTLQFVYRGKGVNFMPASRVYIEKDGNNDIKQTLKDLIADAQETIDNATEAETERYENEDLRITAESSRSSAETTRQAQETSRQNNESTRQSQESTRQSQEATRKNNESARITAETERQSAYQRVTQLEQNSIDGEVLAARGGYPSLSDRLAALDPGVVIKKKTFTATEGQTVFNISDVGQYNPGENKIKVWVGWVPQIGAFTETNSTSITLNTPANAGDIVHVEWYQGGVSLVAGHAAVHKAGGGDEINVTDLAGYQANVADKFTDVTAQLAQKATKEEVDTKIANMGSASPKGTYSTLSALQTAFPTGTTGIYIVTEDGKWYYWSGSAWTAGGIYQSTGIADKSVGSNNLKDNSVNNEKLSKTNINIYDQSFDVAPNIIDNSYIDSSGNVVSLSTYYVSYKIPVRGEFSYNISNIPSGQTLVGAWYDVNNSWISTISTGVTGVLGVKAPSTAASLRLNIQKTRKISSVVDIVGFPSVNSETIAKNAVKGEHIKDLDVTPNKLALSTANLVTSWIDGGYVHNGVVTAEPNTAYTDFIAIEANIVYSFQSLNNSGSINTYKGSYYDSNKTFLGNITGTNEWTSPSTAAFIQFNSGSSSTAKSQNYFRRKNHNMPWLEVKEENLSADLQSKINAPSTNPENSKWNGKTANFLGDSITAGLYNNGASSTSQQYHYWLQQLLGLTIVRQYGVSGSHISSAYGTVTNAFTDRYSSMDNNADLVVVFGGTNDFGHTDTAPIGTMADRTDISFYGAMHVLCAGLIAKYLGKSVVFMTPLHRDNDTAPNTTTGKTLAEYVDIMKEVCEYYGIPVIDLFTMSGFTPRVSSFKTTYMDDGLHPNVAGHELLAKRIYKNFELV